MMALTDEATVQPHSTPTIKLFSGADTLATDISFENLPTTVTRMETRMEARFTWL